MHKDNFPQCIDRICGYLHGLRPSSSGKHTKARFLYEHHVPISKIFTLVEKNIAKDLAEATRFVARFDLKVSEIQSANIVPAVHLAGAVPSTNCQDLGKEIMRHPTWPSGIPIMVQFKPMKPDSGGKAPAVPTVYCDKQHVTEVVRALGYIFRDNSENGYPLDRPLSAVAEVASLHSIYACDKLNKDLVTFHAEKQQSLHNKIRTYRLVNAIKSLGKPLDRDSDVTFTTN